ncbi:MAG: DUF1801 domain-containing protein [Patescibacteria group bacterium]
MFKETKTKTVREYVASVPEERKATVGFLHKFIQTAAPSLKPHISSIGVGYGSFSYKSYKKEILQWPVIGLVNQKNYVSLYVCAVDGGEYVVEKYAKELGKVNVGKSCIRIKKLGDVNLPVLKKVLQLAEKKPGL